jgi:dTDP-6-deoxy-L-talose 4-dehydrogenase (NAD+)
LKVEKPFALTWARLFYVYGEGQPANSLYPQLKSAVQRGDMVFNMSGGEQLRDYLPATEVARLIAELALRNRDIGVINLCSGQPVSVRRLVENWLKENGWNIALNIGYYPYPSHEPMAFWGDRRRLQSIVETR